MKRFLFLFLPALFFAKNIFAQNAADTIPAAKKDSITQQNRINSDTLPALQLTDSTLKKLVQDSGSGLLADSNLISKKPVNEISGKDSGNFITQNPAPSKKIFKGKELLFYFLILLLLLFAFLKNLFPKYFSDLFRLFFRTTLKQRQIREQLMQTPLPSLIFNGFFVIIGALYIDLLVQHFNLLSGIDFWLLFLYGCLGLSTVYLVKYFGLKVSGWLFGATKATDSYIFIVFVVNKMTGIYLLPFLILLAFTEGNLYEISLTLSWIGVGGLLIYRFILTYSAVHNQIKVNLFHFFLYLCAFEVVPLLLVYKVLLFFFR